MHGPIPPDGSPPTGANRKRTRARPDCSVELSSPHRRASPRNPGWRLKGAEVLSEVVRQRERRARVALRRARRNDGRCRRSATLLGWPLEPPGDCVHGAIAAPVGARRQGVPGLPNFKVAVLDDPEERFGIGRLKVVAVDRSWLEEEALSDPVRRVVRTLAVVLDGEAASPA